MWNRIKTGVIYTGIAVLGIVSLSSLYHSEPAPEIPNDEYRLYTAPSHTVESRPILIDDSSTTNDESNDQPLGYYGTETVSACTTHNGTCYDLDVDIEDDEVVKIYFPKGGYIYLHDAVNCYSGDTCYGYDRDDREWEITRY